MTMHFRPDAVVQGRFGGRRRRRWTDPRACRGSRRDARPGAAMIVVLATAACAGLAIGVGLRGGPPSAAATASTAGQIPFFGYCHSGGGANCVVDGDTFYFGRDKVRIANIDAPETHPPRCAAEAQAGEAATHRLRDLLNSGEIALSAIGRDEDIYGRKLRNVAVGGADVGAVLVSEGLARDYGSGRRPWCA